jgi:hypothetical protein
VLVVVAGPPAEFELVDELRVENADPFIDPKVVVVVKSGLSVTQEASLSVTPD